jgi:hypothetical protein
MVKKTYEELAQDVCQAGSLKFYIGQTEVGGMFDRLTKMLVWTVDYSIRDEDYIRKLLAEQP